MASSTAIQRLMALFEGCASASGTHGTPEKDPDGLKWNIKRTATTKRIPVTEKLWEQHVAGKRPLGVIPIREDNSCSWGSIDFDEYDVDLLEIVAKVEASKMPFVPCRSKSGGLHLFLFLKTPEPASDMVNVLRDAAASLGLAECEIFPKQTQLLSDRGDMGNWMVMPYYGDTYGGKLKMQHGLKKTGAEMTLGEFVTFAEKRMTTIQEFAKLSVTNKVIEFPGGKGKKKTKGDGSSKGDFSDGPPCLQHLTASGVQKDGRKRTLFMMALYYKRIDSADWKARLERANHTFFSPPLPSAEVTGVINSCEKKDYEYTCKEEPMKSHCNSTLCRMRKYGVGAGGEYPTITGLSKLDTDPAIWFADVEGARLELKTDELQNYMRFHAACMNKINKCYRVVRQDAWLGIVAEAMTNVVLIEAPPDVGNEGKFHELLEEFLTNRSRGERVEDLFSGRPWENVEEGRHYFTLKSFARFLDQEKVRDLTRGQITSHIKKLGGGHHLFNIKNQRSVNSWYIPSDKVQSIPQLEAPELKKKEDDII
jgi:hypothetical protein